MKLQPYKVSITPIVQTVDDDGAVIGDGPLMINNQTVTVECHNLAQVQAWWGDFPQWLDEQVARAESEVALEADGATETQAQE